MEKNIAFPNLGIELTNIGKNITVLGFEIAFYGMIIGFGILMGLMMAVREAKKTKQNPELYYDLTIYGVVFSFIGARLYYVAFTWDYYKNNLNQIMNIRQGGLAIYGGVIAAVIFAVIFAKKKQVNPLLMLDTGVVGLITGQMIGRWGNFFNREAFGDYTNNLLAMRLPTSGVRSSEITDTMLENIITIGTESFIQVHPTFLYESLWNFGVLVLLLNWSKVKAFPGEIFCVYLAAYGLGRAWIEGLRTDQLLLANGWAVSQVLAIVMFFVATTLIILKRNKIKGIGFKRTE